MQAQPTASSDSWAEEATARSGVVVASGYGVRISVFRGRLRINDGIGANRRNRLFQRATSGLKRLVVLGHTGYVSLEALRWLADIRAAYLQIDADGRVLATFGPPSTDRPSLRRAQAIATQTDQALTLSRWLVDAKLCGQTATLQHFAPATPVDVAVAIIAAYRKAIGEPRTIDDLRGCEAWAAGAYWQALAPLSVRFARRDADRVPSLGALSAAGHPHWPMAPAWRRIRRTRCSTTCTRCLKARRRWLRGSSGWILGWESCTPTRRTGTRWQPT
ncbi:MAG: CRISPR-associated endonuclease Cas1 [Chloroflexi bacterium]|nr:CRISPR-associated endonuclease Cas1 [Chloroflexota bacterium]